MDRPKIVELELSPKLLHRLFQHVRKPEITDEQVIQIVEKIKWFSKADELLTLDQFEEIVDKPMLS